MTRIRIITLALLAVLAVSAFAASSALATTPTGEIHGEAGGALVKKKFTGKSSKPGLLETVAGSKISCESTALTGEALTTKTGTAVFTFSGCESAGSKCKTASPGETGVVRVDVALKGVVLNEKDYLLNLVANEKFESPSTLTITCGTVKVEVKGSLLIPATPLNTLQKEYTFNATGSKGVQEPVETEHPLEANFASKGFEGASLSAKELVTTFEEKVEFV